MVEVEEDLKCSAPSLSSNIPMVECGEHRVFGWSLEKAWLTDIHLSRSQGPGVMLGLLRPPEVTGLLGTSVKF